MDATIVNGRETINLYGKQETIDQVVTRYRALLSEFKDLLDRMGKADDMLDEAGVPVEMNVRYGYASDGSGFGVISSDSMLFLDRLEWLIKRATIKK